MKAPKRWSLRARLLAGVLAVVALGFGCAGVASVHLLREYLIDRVDEQLHLAQHELIDVDPIKASEFVQSEEVLDLLHDYVIEFYDPSGTLKHRFQAPGQLDAPRLPVLDSATVDRLKDKPFYADEDHGAGFRVLISRQPDGGTLVVAYDFSETARTMAKFVGIELVVMLSVLGITAMLGVAMVRMGLRPLTDVEQTAEDIIAGGDLSRRVPELAAPGTEMGRLSRTLNTMLSEIEGSVAKLRRFVGDASHELRTPVTGIRGLAELYRQGAVTDPDEVRQLVERIETEAVRMGLLVEDLLLLARLDEERPLRSDRVDLVPVVADAIEGRPVDLELVGDAEPIVIGDEDRLRQVVTNLVLNALAHTPAGTPITVRVGVRADRAVLEVADNGPGIPAGHADRIFERFYRIDPSRTRDHARSPASGAGLGLSIVAGIVAAHRGTVTLHETDGGGATFRVEFPLA